MGMCFWLSGLLQNSIAPDKESRRPERCCIRVFETLTDSKRSKTGTASLSVMTFRIVRHNPPLVIMQQLPPRTSVTVLHEHLKIKGNCYREENGVCELLDVVERSPRGL